MNEAVVKAITGGDTLATRRLHSNEIIRKKASFTPFVTTNKKLFIRGMDNGIWRRMLTIPLNKKIQRYDRTFADRLEHYASDAKRWFLQEVRDYIQRGHELGTPRECLDAVEENRSGLDTYLGSMIIAKSGMVFVKLLRF